jgi:thiosulfate/3-mercaptopyruvate sulfurtransferase
MSQFLSGSWFSRGRGLLRRATGAILVSALFVMPALAGAVEPLVSAAWLKEHAKDPGLVVLDIRSAIDGGGPEAYGRGHVPGAVHSDYDRGGWRTTRNNIPFAVPSAAKLEVLIGELGIDEDNHVVVVPAGVHATDFGSAARVYWTLKLTGLKNVSILDGGFAAWKAAGYPVESGTKQPTPAIFSVTFDKTMLIDAGEVQKLASMDGAVLIDSRSPGLFSGKERAPMVKAYGHIPGAINIDHALLYNDKTNRLKTRAELAAALGDVPAQGPVVTYCNTGHWSATTWFVMSELLGREEVKLYPGSMVEWTIDPTRPVVSSRTKWDDLLKILGLGS